MISRLLNFCILLLFFLNFIQVEGYAQIGWTKAYDNAVVVAAEERAAEVGNEILKQGGNAIDAAVATQFALAVTLPRAGNIGGGGFMMIRLADGTTTALDFREKAPELASEDMFIRNGEYDPDLSRRSALASGVPGVVDGMLKALERYGNLPLETVIAPAIKLAREGYQLSWIQAKALNDHADLFKKYNSSKKYFTNKTDEPYREGDLFIQADLAKTLDRIARLGRDGFYNGRTADMIVNEMRQQEGIIGYGDLRNYESKWRNPISVSFQGYELHIMPPPSSGSIAIAQMLTMLEDYDLKEMGFNSAEYVHLITEVMRRAFADRAHFLGDPDFVNIPTDKLTSKSYLDERMRSFDPQQASSSDNIGHGEVAGFMESSETTHYSVVDNSGNAVAVTTTLNGSFGNHLAIDGAGFLMNNEMDDFTAEPGEPNMFGLVQGKANAVKPGKRMLSSMTPTIVTKDSKVSMVLGAAGGPRIITATFMSFLNMSIFEMNAQEAISAPRFHHQWLPDKLYIEEYGLSPDTQKLLEAKGHALQLRPTVGRGHIIYVDDHGKKHGAPDPRGDGAAKGY